MRKPSPTAFSMEQPYLQKYTITRQYLKGIFKGNITERFKKILSFALTMGRSETVRISGMTSEGQELKWELLSLPSENPVPLTVRTACRKWKVVTKWMLAFGTTLSGSSVCPLQLPSGATVLTGMLDLGRRNNWWKEGDDLAQHWFLVVPDGQTPASVCFKIVLIPDFLSLVSCLQWLLKGEEVQGPLPVALLTSLLDQGLSEATVQPLLQQPNVILSCLLAKTMG